MSQAVSKALQFVDKKDLECAICLNRFHEPKTLKCMHTYCLQCIQKLVETHGTMKCPTCAQEHDLTTDDLKELASNTMISQLLEYVTKTENKKPPKCLFCDNQPAYHCSACKLYLCEDPCIKQHKRVPETKDHPLYTLDKKEQEGSSQEKPRCKDHCDNTLDFFCSTCNKSACKQCEHILYCQSNGHKMIPILTAVKEFNNDATKIVKLAHEIENKLKEKLELLNDNSEFDTQLDSCRAAIKLQENKLIKTVKEKSKELMSDLEEIHKEKKEDTDNVIQDINSKMTAVSNLIVSVNTMKNKPEEAEVLHAHKTTISTVRNKVLGKGFDQSLKKKNITPNFIQFPHLDQLIVVEGIGKITTVDSMTYKVAKDDEVFTVTKEQAFVVKVSSSTESDACQLATTLINSSGQKSDTEVEYLGNGEYKIKGRCNVEGDWQMKITAGAAHIKGSPVNIKVVSLGLVHTIENISDYKEHNKTGKVTDVVLDTDGCLLVSSYSEDILKFKQSGLLEARLQVSEDVLVNRMHLMGDGHMVYTDEKKKRVVMCDDKYHKIHEYGIGKLKYPNGLTVNKETRVLYVADRDACCVFKFNVDDGSLLGKIPVGSENRESQMNRPENVTLTKEGYVIVADTLNCRIQMFDANGNFMGILVEGGQVWGPDSVIIDMDENIIVSSSHKIQLFDKNGVFIKRIDHEDDGLDTPTGLTVISNRPRRLAVANHNPNNVKIFNY